jgi:hypothetical protein
MTMSFKAGNHVRFAEALVAISIYANAFTADAKVASDIAFMSGSASATPTLNLRVQVMPGVLLHWRPTPLPLVRLSRKSRHSKTAELSFRNGRLYFTEVRPFASGRL